METKTFRLKGVTNRLVQTLLSNVRLGHDSIESVGFDASGAHASVRLRTDARYRHVGQPPPPVQRWLQRLAAQTVPLPLTAIARVVGGGWAVQVNNKVRTEIARYGDYAHIAEHHLVAILQGDYVATPLTHGLEIILTSGFPPPINAPIS